MTKLKKIKSRRLTKRQFALIVSLIIIGVSLLCYRSYSDYDYVSTEKDKIENFFISDDNSNKLQNEVIEEDKPTLNYKSENYVAVLEIPKISLKKGLFDISSKNNNVDKNIKILSDSTMPDVDGGILILAGHSGTGKTAFFKRLVELSIDDTIIVYYKDYKYLYKVYNIYDIEKTGKATIETYKNKTSLVLVTCKGDDKQTIVMSTLISRDYY